MTSHDVFHIAEQNQKESLSTGLVFVPDGSFDFEFWALHRNMFHILCVLAHTI